MSRKLSDSIFIDTYNKVEMFKLFKIEFWSRIEGVLHFSFLFLEV